MIQGLLTQKSSSRAPVVGEVRQFSWEDRTAKSGNTYVKVNNDREQGQACKIISVSKTDWSDPRGNVSYNVEFEVTEEQPTPRQAQSTMTKDDYWARKEQYDREWRANQVMQQPKIMRQHSQHMAILYATLKDQKDITPDKFLELVNWFHRDIERSPVKSTSVEPEKMSADLDDDF